MKDFESNFSPERVDSKKEINEELQYIIKKIDSLHLPIDDIKRIKQELNTFVGADGDDVLEKMKEISKEMDMIMNYLMMLRAAVHDRDAHISVKEVLGKAGKSLSNIYAILRGEDVQGGDGSITIHKEGKKPIQ